MNDKTKWVSDPEHSELGFKIKHLMISTVSGKFNDFEVQSETSDIDFENGQIGLTVKVDSITTNNKKRDEHLINTDFFDTLSFPEMEFNSSALEKLGEFKFKLHGDLTIKGVTHPVVLDMEHSELVKDPWGGERIALNVKGEINRKKWGLTYNAATESGGVMLGEDIKIDGEVQLVKQSVEGVN